MKATDSLYPPDWRHAARRDWHRVAALLGLDDAEGAAFFLQQALEKYLKAYLLGRGWKLRKIHLLHVLLDEAIAHEASLVEFRDLCERVAGYYLTERYPQLSPYPSSGWMEPKVAFRLPVNANGVSGGSSSESRSQASVALAR